MLKFSKSLLTVLGMIALIAFIGVCVYNVIEINQLHAVSSANRSREFTNPRNWVLIGAGLGLLSGFLLGVAMAMPGKSFKRRYAEQRKAEQVNEAHEAGYYGASAVDPNTMNAQDPQI